MDRRTSLKILSACALCAGRHSIEGCPKPNIEQGCCVVYWPPDASSESWDIDTPNEGISFEIETGGEIWLVTYHADYHGCFLIDFEDEKFHTPIESYYNQPTSSYMEAYRALEVVHQRLTERVFRDTLESLGWREVKWDDELKGGSWTWK